MTAEPTDTAASITELLKSFKLPTAAAEMARRLTDAGHDAALEVVAEVLEAEREDRWFRRVNISQESVSRCGFGPSGVGQIT
jgi:hypothetical protein